MAEDANDERTGQAYEPVRESFVCPHRGPDGGRPGTDTWVKCGQDRTCSYCGGIHPDDFVPILKAAADPVDLTHIDQSDKPWKIYIHRPGIKNASEGAIKSYGGHGLPTGVGFEEMLALLREAHKGSAPKMQIIFDNIKRGGPHVPNQ